MQIEKQTTPYVFNSKPVCIYHLQNKNGLKMSVTNAGCSVLTLLTPDKHGRLADIMLGYRDMFDYAYNKNHFGAVIGRVANRIAGAKFTLNGKEYRLQVNNLGVNNLHSGDTGFDKVVFDSHVEGEKLVFTTRLLDNEGGFPGNMDVKICYQLTDDNEWVLEYEGVCDADTIVNMTNHSFFNLSGAASGSIENHELMLCADQYVPVNQNLIPTGELLNVAGTPFDFRTLKRIGQEIAADDEQLVRCGGYDHSFVLKGEGYRKVAEVYEPNSGRVMEVLSTKPALQFYSGNFLDGTPRGKDGVNYQKRGGLCLETHYLPNAINEPNFDSHILKANERYYHKTAYRFGVR